MSAAPNYHPEDESPAGVVAMQPRLFTADEYLQMIDAGIIHEDEHVELIDGVIVQMSPVGNNHTQILTRLILQYNEGFGPHVAWLAVEASLEIGENNVPEPDFMLVRPRSEDDFSPIAKQDVLLIVEIADSSLKRDLQVKVHAYAAAGIPEVWVLDVVSGRVYIHRDPNPSDGKYLQVETAPANARVAPAFSPDRSFDFSRINIKTKTG